MCWGEVDTEEARPAYQRGGRVGQAGARVPPEERYARARCREHRDLHEEREPECRDREVEAPDAQRREPHRDRHCRADQPGQRKEQHQVDVVDEAGCHHGPDRDQGEVAQ